MRKKPKLDISSPHGWDVMLRNQGGHPISEPAPPPPPAPATNSTLPKFSNLPFANFTFWLEPGCLNHLGFFPHMAASKSPHNNQTHFGCLAIPPPPLLWRGKLFSKNFFHEIDTTGGGPRTKTPPPQGASGQQRVANGAGLTSPWAPKAPEGMFCPLCTPPPSLNPTLTLAPTPTLSLVLTLPLPLALTKVDYWDQAGGGSNII